MDYRIDVSGGEPDFLGAQAHARRRLETELPAWLLYHDLEHTVGLVAPAAALLADDVGLDSVGRGLVVTAAWFHDIGFVERYDENEVVALRVAREALPGFGFTPEQVEAVVVAIWATRIPQEPDSLLAEVLCDADLFVLGVDRFTEREVALREELELTGVVETDDEWNARQLRFLEEHRYFTDAARRRNDAGKEQNVAMVRSRLAAAPG